MTQIKKVEPSYSGATFRLCEFCAHLVADGPWRCEAYPEEEGIPQEILWMNVDHRVPYINDRGVQFTLREDLEPIWYEWFLAYFFGDAWGRTEEEIRQEKERYAEMIQGILERRRLPLPTVK